MQNIGFKLDRGILLAFKKLVILEIVDFFECFPKWNSYKNKKNKY
jgi:hypothetical protein